MTGPRDRKPVLTGLVASLVVVVACQGPASASSVDVTFVNTMSESVSISWAEGTGGTSASQRDTVAPCGMFRFGFRAGVTYTIVVRSGDWSQSFVLNAPYVAGERQDTITIKQLPAKGGGSVGCRVSDPTAVLTWQPSDIAQPDGTRPCPLDRNEADRE